jgi:hypothetical protein
VFSFVFLDVVLITLLEIFGQNDVTILTHGLHAGLLTDGVDVGT